MNTTKKQLKDEKILNKHNLNGYIPSPDDARDYTLAMAGVMDEEEFPEEYRTEGQVTVLDQGSVGSCVAHAIATAMAYGEFKAGRTKYTDWSRGFIYGNRRLTDFQAEGMITRQALKQVHHEGDCLYTTFPYNETYPKVKARIEKNSDKYHTEAANYKIKNYFRCITEEEVKRAIMKQGAVVLGMTVYSSFQKNVPLPTSNDISRGGHAMCCVGWNKDGWIIQNSWGKYWGDKGYCYVPYEYPINEWWGITLNDDIPEPPKTNWFVRFINWLISLFK